MSENDYDDGLVHEHGWAKEAPPEGITRLVAPVVHLGAAANDTAAAMNQHPEDMCDEGLVHAHNWAHQEPAAS